jgi:hypothetical protein
MKYPLAYPALYALVKINRSPLLLNLGNKINTLRDLTSLMKTLITMIL